MPKDDFKNEQIFELWNLQLESLKNKGKLVSYNALQNTKMSVKNNTIILFEFESMSMQAEFEKLKTKWLQAVQKKLNNYSLEIDINIVENENVKYILSDEDIFKNMLTKNPFLEDLRKELGLNMY